MNAKVLSFLEKNRTAILEDFQALLRQPSISAKGQGVRECARLVERFMQSAGIQTEVRELREGNPVLLGYVPSKKSKRTLMFYGHYDVQPIEPIEEWRNDAFAAELKDGKIVARGASDSKNNVMALIKAVEAYLETIGELPVNLKFLFEGEEEISSPHLPDFVQTNKEKLMADAVVCYDGGMDDSGRPGIDLGLKGILYVEFRSQKAKVDLHSSRAPIVENPAWRLVWALNTLKGPDEKIKVDGWYDKVHKPTTAEMELLKKIPFDEQKQKSEMGLTSLLLDRKGMDALQSYLFEPTCTICGFLSGHTSAGPKTVLPSKAMAKLDFRLVYDQNPDELLEKLKSHLRKRNFNDLEVAKIGSVEPSKTPADAPIARAVIAAAKQVWATEPVVFPNSPGSGPDYLFTKRLGLNSVWAGCASAFSNMHAPNEFELIDDFFKGIQYAATIMENFAQV
jgi:acetylornithine deacetylase/succinyl-diaminopimelate desuccinylase-like protein